MHTLTMHSILVDYFNVSSTHIKHHVFLKHGTSSMEEQSKLNVCSVTGRDANILLGIVS